MANLVKQASFFPVRKIVAVIVSGAVIGGIQSGLNLVWPDHPFVDLLEQVDIWVQYGVMALAGYMTKEKADVAS
jgi:hypothetical protein